MTIGSTFVYDVTDASFQTDVIERSRQTPVLVDFWAPWCGPCRLLGPILEQQAEANGGAFELAKLNTDENPRTASTYRIEGIPAVKMFKDGRVAGEFVGALPEAQVKAFLARFLPSEADRLTARGDELTTAGHMNAAEDAYREALTKTIVHPAAAAGLARVLAARGAVDEALKLLEGYPQDPRAAAVRAEIQLQQVGGEGVDSADLEERIAADPADVDARYKLGMALAARGSYEQAMDQLLEVVRRDRTYDDDAGRRALVDLFNLLGNDNPLTPVYRKKLSYLLF
jgi:putative thioredoxin